MNPISLIFLTFAMSADTFAAATGKGPSLDWSYLSEVPCTGIVFSAIEAITPLVGWLSGQVAGQFVADWNHWIAFVLPVLPGLHIVHNSLRADHATEQEEPGQHSSQTPVVTALATNIGALTVGAGLAFIDINIFLTAGAISLVATTTITPSTILGRALDAVTGKRAGMVDRVVLVLVGATILYRHLRAV